MARISSRRRAGSDESLGFLYRGGALVAPVHYTLVTVERNGASKRIWPGIYNRVLRFDTEAFAVAS